MTKTCENWLSIVNIYVYYTRQIPDISQELPYSVDFRARRELWYPLSKTVLSKYSFFYKGPVYILKYRKARN